MGREIRSVVGMTIIRNGEAILTVDATIKETHSSELMISEYPREGLSNASNHMQPLQPGITTELVVSKDSLFFEGGLNRDREAYELLRSLQVNRELVTIATSLRIWQDVGLKSLSVPRDKNKGSAVFASCSWKPLETVTSQQTTIPAGIISAPVRSSAKDKDNTSDQVKDDKGNKARKRTLAKGLKEGVFGLFSGD